MLLLTIRDQVITRLVVLRPNDVVEVSARDAGPVVPVESGSPWNAQLSLLANYLRGV
jgi:hypothetical protein